MQAISVKYLPPTNNRCSRLKAFCDRGSVTISYPIEYRDSLDAASIALRALLTKFLSEDSVRYGTTERNPWSGLWFGGTVKDGTTVFVNSWRNDGVTISPAAK